MKKYILMPLVALAAFTACQDFLVEAPVMSQSNELVLSTYEGLDKAVAGAYAPLASTSWYGADFVLINELKTSNGKKWIGSNWDSGRCNDLYNLNYNPNNNTTRVRFYPQTGRTHQLRLHAAHPDGLGCPIVGDDIYGTSHTADCSTEGRRLCLHADVVVFRHPTTGEEMVLRCKADF